MDFGVEVGQERIIGNLIGLGGNNEGFGVGLENVEIGNGQFVGENAAGEV